MNKKQKIIGWSIIGVICIVGFSLVEIYHQKDVEEDRLLLETGQNVKAKIIDIKGNRYGKRKRYALLRYGVNGRVYKSLEKIWKFEKENDFEFSIGDSVDVKIEQMNPRNCVIDFSKIVID